MKPLRSPTDKEQHAYMAMRQQQNRARSSRAETWMLAKLNATGRDWTRQAIRGYRLYDFWNHDLGCAVEVDGKEHDAEYDGYRDEYNFRRSGIIVIRVPNFDEVAADRAISIIVGLDHWKQRRAYLGIPEHAKRLPKRLIAGHVSEARLAKYLETR